MLGSGKSDPVAREQAVQRLLALADLLKLSEGSVADSVHTVLDLSCDSNATPMWTPEVRNSVLEWVAQGENPPLAEELRRLFGEGFCACDLPTVPACSAFYVRDQEQVREQLQTLYRRAGYTPPAYTERCLGTGYVSQQLAFLAHCIEHLEGDPSLLEAAMPVLRDSLFEWLPLFSRALVTSSRHPGALLTGVALQCVLASDPVISPLASGI